MTVANPFPTPRRRYSRPPGDLVFRGLTTVAAATVVAVLVAVVLVLYNGSSVSRNLSGFSILWNPTWNVQTNVFGLLPFLVGTILTSAIALLLAVPLALGSSIFLTQFARQRTPVWLEAVLTE